MGIKVATPRPGDLVEVEETDDVLIEKGSYGVIVNVQRGMVVVVFNYYTPYKKGNYVNASGGPVREIPLKYLKPTDKVVKQTFWTWKDIPEPGRAVYFKRKVKVFKVNLKTMRASLTK